MPDLFEVLDYVIKVLEHIAINNQNMYFDYLKKKLEKFEDRLETKLNKICNCIKRESEYVIDEVSKRISNFVTDPNMNQMGAIIDKLSYDISAINAKISEQENSNVIITNSCKDIEDAINDFGNTKPSQNMVNVDNGFMSYNIDRNHKKVVHTHNNLQFKYSKHINYNIIDLDYLIEHVPGVEIEQIKYWTSKDDLFKQNGKKRIPIGKCIIAVSENDPYYGTQNMEFIVYRKISGMAYLSRKSYSELINSPFL